MSRTTSKLEVPLPGGCMHTQMQITYTSQRRHGAGQASVPRAAQRHNPKPAPTRATCPERPRMDAPSHAVPAPRPSACYRRHCRGGRARETCIGGCLHVFCMWMSALLRPFPFWLCIVSSPLATSRGISPGKGSAFRVFSTQRANSCLAGRHPGEPQAPRRPRT